MAIIDGLIIPRSYNDYINKRNPKEMQNALKNTGYFPNSMSEENLEVEEIFSKNITLKDKGIIKSTNYNGTIDSNGNITEYGTQGWAIDHNGQSDFVDMNLTNLTAKKGVMENLTLNNCYLNGYITAFETPFSPGAMVNIGFNNNALRLFTNKNIQTITRDSKGTYTLYFKQSLKIKYHVWEGHKYIDLFCIGNAHDLFTNGFNNPIIPSINWVWNYIDGRLEIDGEYAIVNYCTIYFGDNLSDALQDPISAQIFLFFTESN